MEGSLSEQFALVSKTKALECIRRCHNAFRDGDTKNALHFGKQALILNPSNPAVHDIVSSLEDCVDSDSSNSVGSESCTESESSGKSQDVTARNAAYSGESSVETERCASVQIQERQWDSMDSNHSGSDTLCSGSESDTSKAGFNNEGNIEKWKTVTLPVRDINTRQQLKYMRSQLAEQVVALTTQLKLDSEKNTTENADLPDHC